MKPSMSYLLLILSIIITITNVANTESVKDSTGKVVSTTASYYIHPVLPGRNGSLKLSGNNKPNKCPLDVVLDSSDNIGDEFIIDNLVGAQTVLTSLRVEIKSRSYPAGCLASTNWGIPKSEGEPPSNLITTGVKITEGKCFVLQEYPTPTNPGVPSYMLEHCPCSASIIIEPSSPNCNNITLYVYEGVGRLASNAAHGGTPLEFVFVPLTSKSYIQ